MRTLFAAVFLLLFSAPSFAQTGDQAVARALACQAVKGTKARLKCFEAALPALSAAFPEAVALSAAQAEAARTAAAEEAKNDFGLFEKDKQKEVIASNDYERDTFGANDLPASARDDDDEEVKRVDGVAVEVGKNNRGKLFVILDNGQVWRQVIGDSSSPYIPRDAAGLPVLIKKGTLGSYFITVGKAKAAFRAERIK